MRTDRRPCVDHRTSPTLSLSSCALAKYDLCGPVTTLGLSYSPAPIVTTARPFRLKWRVPELPPLLVDRSGCMSAVEDLIPHMEVLQQSAGHRIPRS